MVLLDAVLVVAGLVTVVYSADAAIKRITYLAKYLRLSTFVVSFVIAGIVTILPELSIGVVAALEGTSSLGFGVILGSNVADLTMVIGLVALYAGKLKLDPTALKHVRSSFFAVILPVLLFWDAEISRLDGAILVFAYLGYLFMMLRTKREGLYVNFKRKKLRFASECTLLIVILVVLFAGGSLVTENAQKLSQSLGVPLFLVGVLVAIGTCLPELVFSIRASKKKQGEVGLGNILGNILADSMLAIGIIALIQPIQPRFPLLPMVTGVYMATSALVVALLSKKGELNRRDGFLLLVTYGVLFVAQSVIDGFVA
jgi:cation:H+ antiporter